MSAWPETRLTIDGRLVEAQHGATYPNIDPSTGQPAGVAADASPADVERALAAARRAFDETSWPHDLDLRVRGLRQLETALRDHLPELTELTMREVGAPPSACDVVHLGEPLEFLPYYASLAEGYAWHQPLGEADTVGGRADRWIEREPIGVVAAITPWNVPTQINLAKVAPALAAGCSVVLKPAPQTPWSALALGRLVTEHTDIPAGVLNVVSAADPTIGAQLTEDPRVDMISFTGSTATGKTIMRAAAEHVTKVFLELGGKSAMILLDDLDDLAAPAMTAAFGTAMVCGQGCALSTRILIPRHRYAEVVDTIATMFASITTGPPTEAGVLMGPLIDVRQRERVAAYVRSAVEDGARVVCGGARPPGLDAGAFYLPTLLADVTPDMRVAREEIFGPVLVAIPFDDDEDAIRIANDSIYGLSGHVFADDEERALAVARRIRTGTISVNGGIWYGADVPFGGYRQSGIGREMGVAGFEEYLETKVLARPVSGADR